MRRRPRPLAWLRAHPRHADWMLATLITIGSLVTFVFDNGSGARSVTGGVARKPDVFGAVLIVAAGLPLLARRRRPSAVLAATTIAVLISQLIGYADDGVALTTMIAAYSVGAHSTDRRRAVRSAVLIIGGLCLLNLSAIWRVHKTAEPISSAVGNAIVFATAFLLGDNLRRRRLRLADLEERAQANERERELVARQAVSDEQRRIARELHDIVAHSLSVMVVQAGAARRVIAKRPDDAQEALGNIEVTGRAALAEMRQLLGVLRGEEQTADDALAPQPSLDRLNELTTSDPDLAVEVTIEGAVAPLPATVDVQAYRIVQEALTNVRKHAGPAAAQVVLRYSNDGVHVVVRDNGRGASANGGKTIAPRNNSSDHFGHGHGLVGMRERVALCHGMLHAGPQPGGGWIVEAFLPTPAAAPGPAATPSTTPTTTAMPPATSTAPAGGGRT